MTSWHEVQNLQPGQPATSMPVIGTTGAVNVFPKRYRAILFTNGTLKPKGFRQHWVMIWGTDIWFGKWPFLKLLAAANVAAWIGWVMSR